MTLLFDLGLILCAYLFGSLPFAIWVTRWRKGIDIRQAGSYHATATNTLRQAGLGAGILVALLDIAKGFAAVYLARILGNSPWVVPLCAAFAVVGHCWPLFAGFRGGMGLAVSGGALLAVNPLAFLVGVGLLVALVLTLRHSARASVLAGLLVPWVNWVLGMRGVVFWVALAVGLVFALRFLEDWNRQYRELWLDRST